MFETKWTKKLEDYGEKSDEQEETPFKFSITPRQIADNASRRIQKDQEDESQE